MNQPNEIVDEVTKKEKETDTASSLGNPIGTAVVLAVIFLPLLYAVSVGPVAFFLIYFNLVPSTLHTVFESFYTPLILLAKATGTFSYYCAYLNWCVNLAR